MAPATPEALPRGRAGVSLRLARRLVTSRLERLAEGRLEVAGADGTVVFGAASDDRGLDARIDVIRPRFWRRVALQGIIGAAESWADGDWTSPDLTTTVRVLLRNRSTLTGLDSGFVRRCAQTVDGWVHRLRANSRRGSRRNIAAHYDLGNDFFAAFLDETMMYSCAIYPEPESTLEEASLHKLDVVCRKLQLEPGDEVLEIGTGWGGFAIHAARHYGARVVTTTVSKAQYEMAERRIREAGLEDQITLLDSDYRDLPERVGRRFHKAVSIEMIEAVGERHLADYFKIASDLLEPDGEMLLQAIVISDQEFDRYRRSVDFIQRHIFPGSLLPSVSAMTERLARVTDLRLFHLEDITPHYARTLESWRQRFHGRWQEIGALGYPESLLRMWEFYFCYCEGGFMERVVGDVQLILTKPLNRRPSLATRLGSP